MKQCSKCQELLDDDLFGKNAAAKDGKRSWCKKCTSKYNSARDAQYSEYRKQWRDTNPWYNNYKKKYYDQNKERVLLANAKYVQTVNGKLGIYIRNAKRRKVEWNMTVDQFQLFWNKPCFYCGGEIATIGLDRIDNNLGYTVNNVRPCCSICNYMKSNMPADVFITHIHKISQNFHQ